MTSKLILTSLAAATAALMAFAVAPAANAASPSEEQCALDGGTFSRDKGTVSCTTTSTTGKSPKSQTIEDDESSQGTFNNKPKHEENCDGPGNSGDGSAHCN